MCPLAPAERRLRDAAGFWERAYAAYFDPEEFRVNLQATIQALRSVTFVLQAQKNALPGFDTWYATQQAMMKQDKRLRWLVESRNFIEKQGDLATRSRFLVTFSNSWQDETPREFPLRPEVPARDVAKIIANTIPSAKINEEAILRFERQWVDSQLPDDELLTVLVHCWGKLRDVVVAAHALRAPSLTECEFEQQVIATNDHLPGNMLAGEFPRVAWFKLRRGKLAEYETRQASLTGRDVEKEVGERYTMLPTAFAGLKEAKTFQEMCEAWFQGAKVFLQRDGFHAPMAIVGTDRAPLMFQLRPADRADQHAMIRDLASRCERANARWCVFITEAWMKHPRSPYKHAANDPRRGEALVLHGVHEDGTKILCQAVFSREGKKIVLQPEKTTVGTLPPAMQAIAQAVGRSHRPIVEG